jgi:hypothetical protein
LDPDRAVPCDESLEVLCDLVDEGIGDWCRPECDVVGLFSYGEFDSVDQLGICDCPVRVAGSSVRR